MRKSIFVKATKLLNEHEVKITDESENAIFFSVKGHNLAFENRHGLRIMPCTCKFSTLNSGNNLLCSHQIAAIVYRTLIVR